MPCDTSSMLIFGPKLLMGANLLSSPNGFRNGACGGCARAAVEATSAHRKMSEAVRDLMQRSLWNALRKALFLRTACAPRNVYQGGGADLPANRRERGLCTTRGGTDVTARVCLRAPP